MPFFQLTLELKHLRVTKPIGLAVLARELQHFFRCKSTFDCVLGEKFVLSVVKRAATAEPAAAQMAVHTILHFIDS
jgi:hypothetical protein